MTAATVDLNVVLLPDEDVKQQVISWSALIARQHPAYFVLDGRTLHPHLTLYQARYPKSVVRAGGGVQAEMEELARSTAPFNVHLNGFSVFPGVVFYDAVKDDALDELHRVLVQRLSPLRNGLLLPVHEQLLNASIPESKKLSILTWGNPMCMDEFDPHISISRLPDDATARKALSLLQSRQMLFQVQTLALTTVGDHGTCPEILTTYSIE